MTKKQNFKHKQDLINLPLLRKYKRLSKADLIFIIEDLMNLRADADYLLIRTIEEGVSDKLYASINRYLILNGYDMGSSK